MGKSPKWHEETSACPAPVLLRTHIYTQLQHLFNFVIVSSAFGTQMRKSAPALLKKRFWMYFFSLSKCSVKHLRALFHNSKLFLSHNRTTVPFCPWTEKGAGKDLALYDVRTSKLDQNSTFCSPTVEVSNRQWMRDGLEAEGGARGGGGDIPAELAA